MKLRRASILNTLGGLVRFGLNLASIPILINSLGLELYGVWAVLIAVVNIALVLRPGWNEGLTHFVARASAQGDATEAGSYLGTSLVLNTLWGGLMAVGMWSLSGQLLPMLFAQAGAGGLAPSRLVFGLMGFIAWGRLLQQWGAAALAGHMRYDITAGLETAVSTLLTLGLIGLSLAHLGLGALAGWTLVVTAASALLQIGLVFRVAGMRASQVRVRLASARRLSGYGLASWAANLGGVLFAQGDRLLASALLDPATTGLYAAATSVAYKINEIIALPLQALVPAVSATTAHGSHERVADLFRRAYRLNSALVWVLAVGLTLLSQLIAVVLVPAAQVPLFAASLLALVVLFAFYCLNGPAASVNQGVNRVWINALATVTGGGLSLLLMALTMPWLGLAGAVLGNIGFQTTWLITLDVCRKNSLSLKWLTDETAPIAAAIVITAGLVALGLHSPLWYLAGVVVALGMGAYLLSSRLVTEVADIIQWSLSTWRAILQRIMPGMQR